MPHDFILLDYDTCKPHNYAAARPTHHCVSFSTTILPSYSIISFYSSVNTAQFSLYGCPVLPSASSRCLSSFTLWSRRPTTPAPSEIFAPWDTTAKY